MNTTRNILNTPPPNPGARQHSRHVHDLAAAAHTRTHGAHGRTSRAAQPAEPTPFDKAMKAADQAHESPEAPQDSCVVPGGDAKGEAPNAHEGADSVEAATGDQRGPTAPAEAGPLAPDAHPAVDAPPPAHAATDGVEALAAGDAESACIDTEAVQATIGALLNAPLTVHNLNELLATIDPRLAASAPVRVGTAMVAVEGGEVRATTGAVGEITGAARNEAPSAGAEPAATASPPVDDVADIHARGLDCGDGETEAGPVVSDAAILKHDERSTRSNPSAEHRPSWRTDQSGANAATQVDSQRANGPPLAAGVHIATEAGLRHAEGSSSRTSPVATQVGAVHAGGITALVGGQHASSDRGLQGQHAATLGTLADAQDSTFTGQVSRGLAAALKQGADGSVTIRLHPASLGQVRVRVAVDGNKVDVRFAAGTPQARALLSSSLDALRESVERRGFSIESLGVDDSDAESTHRTEAAHQAGTQAAQDAHVSTRPHDHGGSAVTAAFDQGHGGSGEDAGDRGGAERRQDGGGAAGHAVTEAGDWDARGDVHATLDGVHDQLGRLMMRLDALA